MRTRTVVVAFFGALLLSLGTTALAQASSPTAQIASTHRGPVQRVAVDAAGSCHQQLKQDSGVGIVSQKFDVDNEVYNSRGVDDFRVTEPCTVMSVDVVGVYFNGEGPADSEKVNFYQDDHGSGPGELIDTQAAVGTDTNGLGSLHITLNTPVELMPGTYWISVRVNMSGETGGEWGWETTTVLRGSGAQWKNHRDGFQTGCLTYTTLMDCVDAGLGPDFMFSVNEIP